MHAIRVRSVCYMLRSFPEPSETFIADEAISLTDRGVRVDVVHLAHGDGSILQPSARALMETGCVRSLGESSRVQQLFALTKLILQRPLGIWRVVNRLLRSTEKWTYLQTLPIASEWAHRRIDYVHAHFADNNFLFAQALADWLGCPFGVTMHGYDIRGEALTLSRASVALNRASLIITISQLNRKLLQESFGLSPQQVQIIRCGIDLSRFRFSPERESDGDRVRIVNVGRLVPVKAHRDLLHAVAILSARGMNCSLDIVGAGPLRESLSSLAMELGISDRVHFLGAQTSDYVIRLVSNAHVFALSSHNEGLPVACIESMALGTPVVATAVAALHELIDHGTSGLLVEPGKPDLLAEAIEKIVSSPNRAREFALAGRRKVELEFDRQRCTDEFLEAISVAVQ